MGPKAGTELPAFPIEVQPKQLAKHINHVLLVKIEGLVWYTIYHHLPVVKGVSSNPSINQPTNGKKTSMKHIVFLLSEASQT